MHGTLWCTMVVIGHRGATVHAPENTVVAMRAALDAGADGVEFDVRLSADGFPVVMHDDELMRMTGASGTVGGSTLAHLRTLSVGAQIGHGSVPTIEEVLDVVRGMPFVICELKAVRTAAGAYGARPVLDAIIGKVGQVPGLVLTSFDPVALVAAHALLPAVPTVLACYRNPDDDWMLPLAAADGHRAVSIPADQVDGGFVRAAHDQGTEVYAFSAPASDARRFAESGIDAIITSDPALARATMR